jgi:hypothetical protein
MYARGDLVAGVDEELPLDEEFWVDALDADLRLYTDLKDGLQIGARAAESEAIVMRVMADSLSKGEVMPSAGLVKDARRLVTSFDPDHKARRVEPRKGALAPLAMWLGDRTSPAGEGKEIVAELRRFLNARGQRPPSDDAQARAVAAAIAAADHLDTMADLLTRAWEQDRFDSRSLKATVALVAATATAQVELHRQRQSADPWATPNQLSVAHKAAVTHNISQLATLVELMARHRQRKVAAIANTRQRASHAAVARSLEVQVPSAVGHSGDAAKLSILLQNRSHNDLDIRLNVAMPSAAWTVLEPQARGGQGLMFVGPIPVPARSEENLDLVIYVPTTVKLDSYIVPIEVVPEPRDVSQEQVGEVR